MMPQPCTDDARILLASRPHSRQSPARLLSTRALYVGLLVSSAACSSGQNHLEPPPPPVISSADAGPGNPAPNLATFSQTVDQLQGIVTVLGETPPLSQGEGLMRAFDRLSASIESIPGPLNPARAEAARLMRSRDFDVWVSLSRENSNAAAVRESLAVAAGALMLAAEGSYAVPEVKTAALRLKNGVDQLDGEKPLRDQREQVLARLRDALEVLKAIRAVAPTVVGRDGGVERVAGK
jgi:hypothetical protein